MKIEKENAILLDLGGVVFENNPQPKEQFEFLLNLVQGKNLEATASYFNIQNYLEEIKQTETYKNKPLKARDYYAGDLLLDKLMKDGILNPKDLIDARIDAVRMRDERIIQKIRDNFRSIRIGIATQDSQTVHEVIKHYLPEIAEDLRIVTTDKDIDTFKTKPDYYYNASKRLYMPTSNMVLVDDGEANIETIEQVGGYGKLFNPNDSNQSLDDTVLEAIEESLKR